MAKLNKKIFELDDADLARLAMVRQYRSCPSEVEALRHCIRETHRMDVERVKESIAVEELLGSVDCNKFLEDYRKFKK